MYDQGVEFLGHEFKSILMEQEYGINTKPASPGNPQANATMERVHQVLGNIVRTYNIQETHVDEAYPWMGILAASGFVVRSMYHRTKQKILGQLVFGRYMTLPIYHISNWRYIRQQKQTQI